ncbi:cytochrome P450 [Auricularia subglabra TFB-10046 SS5]|nr:cytochrome P450 [Auricularia subglabra TFB-10046 SS5]
MPSITEPAWLKFSEWTRQYGDVVYLNLFGQPMIILGSPEAANDLLVKRGAIYSDRPRFTMAYLSGWELGFSLAPYGDRFRNLRRFSGQVMNSRTLKRHVPVQFENTLRFLQKLLDAPEQFSDHVRWLSGCFILKLAYGYDIKDSKDPLVELAEEALDNFSASSSPGWAVDIFPALRYLPLWFPGASFLRQADAWKRVTTKMYDIPFDDVKEQLRKGRSSMASSFAGMLLLNKQGDVATDEYEKQVKYLVGSLYGAGADTTVSAELSFILAMTLYPDIQRRAQAEIDHLTGGTRLPSYQDRDDLPYVEAIVKETQRWNPVLPGGIPHRSTSEDIYRGYRIPAGSIVIANVWHIAHDPESYPDPVDFKPERYLGANESTTGNCDPRNYVFGFGRRECPGRFVADSAVWLMVALTLATFDISTARDDQGREIVPDIEYTTGVISHSLPFKCTIKPRSSGIRELIATSATPVPPESS